MKDLVLLPPLGDGNFYFSLSIQDVSPKLFFSLWVVKVPLRCVAAFILRLTSFAPLKRRRENTLPNII